MTTIEEMYIQNKSVAEAVAKRISNQLQRPLYEVQDHADFALALLLLERLDEWDESQGSLAKWLYMKIYYRVLIVLVRGRYPSSVENVRETPQRERPSTETFHKWDRGEIPAPASAMSGLSRIQRMLQEVGEEGLAILQILRDLPSDLWEEIRPRQGRTQAKKEDNFRKWLVDTKDWTHERVEQAIQEVMECL